RSATAATRTTLPSGGMLSLLELVLETLEPFSQHVRGVDAGERGDALADAAAGRSPPHRDVDTGGPHAGRPEAGGPTVGNERTLDRSPGDGARRLAARHDRVELQRRAGRPADDPVGPVVSELS